ncbi:MAG TPA: tRNA epoxyqueuosine(34) reductase QueG [Candidatus Krumholzibacteria bacterium]|nr:tRNA epoxyqueuosine(34) reductase QueG [Candidatus Krumholzibacteria bacterium]HPD70885.1 tRNA epoxyqueuosine(34) reductase QueG [Candidatus Krumholzibacteria bacterium]HRY39415.1 tRNA epoxyqueuosine(34) reductase QueG [Candidatus Krumholzibacteria bacterium]
MDIAIRTADLAARLAELCPRHRIDLAGAAPLDAEAPHAAAWRAWLDAGRHAGLEYLAATRHERSDPRRRNPWARSLVVFAQRYTDGWPAADPAPGWLAGVARYARGRDYHDVLLADVRDVLAGLRADWPELVAHPAVDTGPYLERDWAAAAGLGFVGKNTCLIHETLGSGFFLAVAPTNLLFVDLPSPPRPLYEVSPRGRLPRVDSDRCGTCTRCLDACPTAAFAAPRVLDAGRCLSTWTIEWRGRAPAADRERQRDHLFGCDVCQQVCPWNDKALRLSPSRPAPPADYAPLAAHGELDLGDLLALDEATFRARLRRTPLWRAHPAGLRRNALVVAANTGRVDLLDVARRLAETDPDPETRAVAAWAAARLEDRS